MKRCRVFVKGRGAARAVPRRASPANCCRRPHDLCSRRVDDEGVPPSARCRSSWSRACNRGPPPSTPDASWSISEERCRSPCAPSRSTAAARSGPGSRTPARSSACRCAGLSGTAAWSAPTAPPGPSSGASTTAPLTVAAIAPGPADYEFFYNYQRPHAPLAYRTPNEHLVAVESARPSAPKVASRYRRLALGRSYFLRHSAWGAEALWC